MFWGFRFSANLCFVDYREKKVGEVQRQERGEAEATRQLEFLISPTNFLFIPSEAQGEKTFLNQKEKQTLGVHLFRSLPMALLRNHSSVSIDG